MYVCDVICYKVKMRKVMIENELKFWVNNDIYYCYLGKFF